MSQRQNSPNVTQKGVIFVERGAQLSPQVRRGVTFFEEEKTCHPPNSGAYIPPVAIKKKVGKIPSMGL